MDLDPSLTIFKTLNFPRYLNQKGPVDSDYILPKEYVWNVIFCIGLSIGISVSALIFLIKQVR